MDKIMVRMTVRSTSIVLEYVDFFIDEKRYRTLSKKYGEEEAMNIMVEEDDLEVDNREIEICDTPVIHETWVEEL